MRTAGACMRAPCGRGCGCAQHGQHLHMAHEAARAPQVGVQLRDGLQAVPRAAHQVAHHPARAPGASRVTYLQLGEVFREGAACGGHARLQRR